MRPTPAHDPILLASVRIDRTFNAMSVSQGRGLPKVQGDGHAAARADMGTPECAQARAPRRIGWLGPAPPPPMTPQIPHRRRTNPSHTLTFSVHTRLIRFPHRLRFLPNPSPPLRHGHVRSGFRQRDRSHGLGRSHEGGRRI